MDKYLELYTNDPRFTRYVDACMSQECKPLVDMLQLRTIRLVGDYYADNPAKEEPTVTTTNCGCGGC